MFSQVVALAWCEADSRQNPVDWNHTDKRRVESLNNQIKLEQETHDKDIKALKTELAEAQEEAKLAVSQQLQEIIEQVALNVKQQELLMAERMQQVVDLTGQCNEATEAKK